MRLAEFASAQDQLALWKLISDTVWSRLSTQSQSTPLPAQARPTPRPQAKPAPQRKSISKPNKLKARKVKTQLHDSQSLTSNGSIQGQSSQTQSPTNEPGHGDEGHSCNECPIQISKH